MINILNNVMKIILILNVLGIGCGIFVACKGLVIMGFVLCLMNIAVIGKCKLNKIGWWS